MDSRTFIKMVKDCNLLDSRFGTGDVDILFQKAKTREAGGVNVAGQKVGFRTFVGTVLPGIAAKKGCTNQDLIRVLMKSEGPQLTNVTEVEKVRFHDDRSTYTGTHAV